MDKDFSEIIEYLDGKFQKVATKKDLEDFATKKDLENFATKEDLERGLEKMKDEIKTDFADLQTSVDAYAKKADTYFQEMVLLSHKVERHEKWFHQVAEKLGIKLEY